MDLHKGVARRWLEKQRALIEATFTAHDNRRPGSSSTSHYLCIGNLYSVPDASVDKKLSD